MAPVEKRGKCSDAAARKGVIVVHAGTGHRAQSLKLKEHRLLAKVVLRWHQQRQVQATWMYNAGKGIKKCKERLHTKC